MLTSRFIIRFIIIYTKSFYTLSYLVMSAVGKNAAKPVKVDRVIIRIKSLIIRDNREKFNRIRELNLFRCLGVIFYIFYANI